MLINFFMAAFVLLMVLAVPMLLFLRRQVTAFPVEEGSFKYKPYPTNKARNASDLEIVERLS